MKKDFEVAVSHLNTEYSTQQKSIHLKLFWPKSTILISKSTKYQNLQ